MDGYLYLREHWFNIYNTVLRLHSETVAGHVKHSKNRQRDGRKTRKGRENCEDTATRFHQRARQLCTLATSPPKRSNEKCEHALILENSVNTRNVVMWLSRRGAGFTLPLIRSTGPKNELRLYHVTYIESYRAYSIIFKLKRFTRIPYSVSRNAVYLLSLNEWAKQVDLDSC